MSNPTILSIRRNTQYNTVLLFDSIQLYSTYDRKNKGNWTGHIFCTNCLLKQFIEGEIERRIEVRGRRGRRCNQLPDDVKEMRNSWKLIQEALDRNGWRTRFGRRYGYVVRQTTK